VLDPNVLDLRIRQMHAALDDLSTSDLSVIKPQIGEAEWGQYMEVDFNNCSDADLHNMASLMINNIACIKDHLKYWCKKYKVTFEGDTVINTNKNSVALIHDLWNVEKHAVLDKRPPRSGHTPMVKNLQKELVLSSVSNTSSGAVLQIESMEIKTTGSLEGLVMFSRIKDESGIVASIEIESSTGIKTNSARGGSCALQLSGQLVDQTDGKVLGDFSDICKMAIDKWDAALRDAGVTLP
jgi:hypothetical protein